MLTTETVCHWEQVQRQWKWEWASYNPRTTGVFWTATGEGTTEFRDEATLAPAPPDTKVDMSFGSRWEKASGTGTNVVIATVDLAEGIEPVGEGWQMVASVAR